LDHEKDSMTVVNISEKFVYDVIDKI